MAKPPPKSEPPDESAPLWTVDDVARFCGVPRQTVYVWDSAGTGPPSHKLGRHRRWFPRDVIDWVRRQP